jgi:hypothetical protein
MFVKYLSKTGVKIVPKRHRKSGSMAVETAIFLPLFLIGLLTLGCLIRLAAVEENVYHALADETRRLAAEAAVPARALFFETDVERRILSENETVDRVDTEIYLYRYPYYSVTAGKYFTDLIGVSEGYHMKLGIPAIFRDGIDASASVVMRAFVGTNNAGEILPFSEMETDDDSHLVWIFPRAGEKYHGRSCSYIQNEPVERILTTSVKSAYSPCELCKPDAVSIGSLVYCFESSGKAYHTGSCFIVDRYVVSISEQDALDAGYTACAKCGGR